MKYVIEIFATVLLLATNACVRSGNFDETTYQRLVTYSESYNHAVVSDVPALREKVLHEIEKDSTHERVLVSHDADFSLVVEKDRKTGLWTPRAFIRMRFPERTAFADPLNFLRSCADYHASVWVMKHPTKPYYFRPAVAMIEVRPGVWGIETGRAVVAGPGLFVEVDASGKLLSIKEIHNSA